MKKSQKGSKPTEKIIKKGFTKKVNSAGLRGKAEEF
jgi:hypothetical protein